MDVKTLEAILGKIDGAYHDRDDYPPMAIMGFEDRPRYHAYIQKLIREAIEEAEAE